jgi:hypothetical protein
LAAIQFGFAPDGVASIAFIPASAMRSIILSSQSNSNRPSSGSSVAQAKMPMLNEFIFASRANRKSASITSGRSSHWSGL